LNDKENKEEADKKKAIILQNDQYKIVEAL